MQLTHTFISYTSTYITTGQTQLRDHKGENSDLGSISRDTGHSRSEMKNAQNAKKKKKILNEKKYIKWKKK